MKPKSSVPSYTYLKNGSVYELHQDGRLIMTPAGRPLTTADEELAQALLEDLAAFGPTPGNPCSLVSYQCSYLDFFLTWPRKKLEASVLMGVSREWDWTLDCPSAAPETMMPWYALFGVGSEHLSAVKAWVPTLTTPELCAVTVLGRSLESVNLAFLVATVVKRKELKRYAREIATRNGMDTDEVLANFEKFLFFYESKQA